MGKIASRLLLVSAGALIDARRCILLAQRPQGKSMAGLWEFPGGKIEPGESPESALIRELKEELGLELEPGALKPLSFASHAYQDFHLLMPVFTCCAWRGEVRGREGQATKWVKAEALEQYPMPPADAPIIPLVRKFIEDLAD